MALSGIKCVDALASPRAVALAAAFALLQLSMSSFALPSGPKNQSKAPDPARKQDAKPQEGEKKKEETKPQEKLSPVEVLVEFTIIAYGGRKQLETARSATAEDGTIRLVTDSGDLTGSYLARSIRRAKSWEDLLRVDLELTPPASTDRSGGSQPIKYTIAFNGASVWSAQNGQYITPRPEAEAAFKAQLTHDYTTLLHYKEDGSKLELIGPETVVGIPTNVVDLTTTTGEKTRYWISTKTYRILHAEYELSLSGQAKPTRYHVSYFYVPFRVVQNTLIPTRRETSQDGKVVQEIMISNVTCSAKIDPEVFQHLQE